MAPSRPALSSSQRRGHTGAVVRALPGVRSDAEVAAALRRGEPWARAALFEAYAAQVTRVLRRLMGPEAEADLPDLIQEVFVRAFAAAGSLRDAVALPAWMQTIATRTAYRAIRTRRTRRWLRFWEPSELPELPVDGIDLEICDACRRTYAVLDRLPAAERIAFILRHVEKLELAKIADACDVSLSTIKRRLVRAQHRFARLATHDPVLCEWLEEGGKWRT